jgi:hypothetical protein
MSAPEVPQTTPKPVDVPAQFGYTRCSTPTERFNSRATSYIERGPKDKYP